MPLQQIMIKWIKYSTKKDYLRTYKLIPLIPDDVSKWQPLKRPEVLS